MFYIKTILKTIFILSPKMIMIHLKNKRFALAISTIMATPLMIIPFIPIVIYLGWIIGIISFIAFAIIGTIFNLTIVPKEHAKLHDEEVENIIDIFADSIS